MEPSTSPAPSRGSGEVVADEPRGGRGPHPRQPADLPRVVLSEEGPVLVPGPVEVVLPDGRSVISDRPVVALCTCRRSRLYPLCDTSHRRKRRRRKEDPS